MILLRYYELCTYPASLNIGELNFRYIKSFFIKYDAFFKLPLVLHLGFITLRLIFTLSLEFDMQYFELVYRNDLAELSRSRLTGSA